MAVIKARLLVRVATPCQSRPTSEVPPSLPSALPPFFPPFLLFEGDASMHGPKGILDKSLFEEDHRCHGLEGGTGGRGSLLKGCLRWKEGRRACKGRGPSVHRRTTRIEAIVQRRGGDGLWREGGSCPHALLGRRTCNFPTTASRCSGWASYSANQRTACRAD
jgi:hypothetical protein